VPDYASLIRPTGYACCINGGNEVANWKPVKSFVFVDTESWFEVLSPTPPEVWLDGELLSDNDLHPAGERVGRNSEAYCAAAW
jgi:hypothetical protein